MSTPTIPIVQAPSLDQSPAFGAVCARCHAPFRTRTWKAPLNTHCPNCMTGIAKAIVNGEIDRPIPVLWVDVINATWGAGS